MLVEIETLLRQLTGSGFFGTPSDSAAKKVLSWILGHSFVKDFLRGPTIDAFVLSDYMRTPFCVLTVSPV